MSNEQQVCQNFKFISINSNLSNKQPIGNYALFEQNSTDTANIGIDLAVDNIYIHGVRKDNKNIIGLNIFPDRITSPCYDAKNF